MKRLNVLLLVLAAVAVSSGCIEADSPEHRKVTEVVDGDTIRVNGTDGGEAVRLIGVDAPETFRENQPRYFGMEDTESNRNCLKRRGLEAENYVEDLVENRTVVLDTDREAGLKDQYGRRLAHVSVNGRTVSERLLRKGYATVFPEDFKYRKKYLAIEAEARDKGLGVWNC